MCWKSELKKNGSLNHYGKFDIYKLDSELKLLSFSQHIFQSIIFRFHLDPPPHKIIYKHLPFFGRYLMYAFVSCKILEAVVCLSNFRGLKWVFFFFFPHMQSNTNKNQLHLFCFFTLIPPLKFFPALTPPLKKKKKIV